MPFQNILNLQTLETVVKASEKSERNVVLCDSDLDNSMKNFHIATRDLDFVILYGSQLGQAKSIAENIADVSEQHYDLKTDFFSLNEVVDVGDLQKVKCPIVIITSTTGDGDPPENADKFWRKIRRKNLEAKTLLFVRYAILGLGDTNFNNFCNCGKQIHKRFQELGATLFYPTVWADDGTGTLDIVVDGWIKGLWPALNKSIGITSKSAEIITKSFLVNVETKTGSHINSVNESSKSDSMDKPSEPAAVTKTLTLPSLPATSLVFEYGQEKNVAEYDPLTPHLIYPLIDGLPVRAKLLNARLLTKTKAVKTTIQITLGIENDEPFEFEPGDSIGIVCPNPSSEVNSLLKHLCVDEDRAELEVVVTVKPDANKGKVPQHVPVKSTLRNLFTYICDIRSPPKKALLRLLAESTHEDSEKARLLELCSRQGAHLYTSDILNPGVSLLDVLMEFPSCKPNLESLVEHLPRLTPRAYSICSSPMENSNSFNIAFNIIEIPKDSPRHYSRLGVCTGWLYNLCKEKFLGKDDGAEDHLTEILSGLENLNLAKQIDQVNESIVTYRRKNQHFRLPIDLTKDIVMIGPGTGVAPFIGFLEHLDHKRKQNSSLNMGKSFLYFGCRHKERDFLYENELKKFSSSDILTKLYVSFSRDEPREDGGAKYVQDLMLHNQEEIVSTLLDSDGYLYVCGDAKNMARNVRETLMLCFQNVKGVNEKDAMAQSANLVMSKHYLQDVWS